MLTLEVQDVAHLLVGRHQLALLVIEGQTHHALVEDPPVALVQLPVLLLMEDALGLVGQRTEEVGGCLQCRVGILCYPDVAYPVPLFLVLLRAPVPSEEALCGLVAFDEASEGIGIEVAVFWMDVRQALLIAHAFLRQEVAVHVVGKAVMDGELQHVVVAGVECVLHDG